jgi:hypothetical protein
VHTLPVSPPSTQTDTQQRDTAELENYAEGQSTCSLIPARPSLHTCYCSQVSYGHRLPVMRPSNLSRPRHARGTRKPMQSPSGHLIHPAQYTQGWLTCM